VSAVFDDHATLRWAHQTPGFERVLHVAHHEWHGIRNAISACPGHKLLISHDAQYSEDDYLDIERQIDQPRIERIVFQGYSDTADRLALRLRARLDSAVRMSAITHVTATQFENPFEMQMQARLGTRRRYGVFDRLGSVKPDFARSFDAYWSETIMNFAPDLRRSEPNARSRSGAKNGPQTGPQGSIVYLPLDIGWRKNMFTNVLAALQTPGVTEIWTTNYPNGLDELCSLERLHLVGYLRGAKLLARCAESDVVLLATLAECQPMTALEALAVGTPPLTGPLALKEFASDPLTALTETPSVDNPTEIARALGRLIEARRADETAMAEMIADHLDRRHALAAERYAAFLDL